MRTIQYLLGKLILYNKYWERLSYAILIFNQILDNNRLKIVIKKYCPEIAVIYIYIQSPFMFIHTGL